VGILPALGEISKGLVERVGSLLVAFQAFHSPAISTTRTLSPSGSFNCRHPRVLIVAGQTAGAQEIRLVIALVLLGDFGRRRNENLRPRYGTEPFVAADRPCRNCALGKEPASILARPETTLRAESLQAPLAA